MDNTKANTDNIQRKSNSIKATINNAIAFKHNFCFSYLGGGQPPMNHYGFISGIPYGHPQSPRSLDKPQPHLVTPPQSQQLPATSQPPNTQNEPQNLKIKQEIPENAPNTTTTHVCLPPFSQSSVQNLPTNVPGPQIPAYPVVSTSSANYSSSSGSHATPMGSISDPLQSLKDVKVPGFSMPAAVAQSIGATNERPSSGPAVENIKKEPEFVGVTQAVRPTSSSPARPPVEKSPALKSGTPTQQSVSQTPPLRHSGKFNNNSSTFY